MTPPAIFWVIVSLRFCWAKSIFIYYIHYLGANMLDVPVLCSKVDFYFHIFTFRPVYCPLCQWGLDTVTRFCCVVVQIILINCQWLILAGWHRLKNGPQGMLGVYIVLSTGRQKSLQLKMCQWKCLQATVFPLFLGGVGTEEWWKNVWPTFFVEAWKYVKLQG